MPRRTMPPPVYDPDPTLEDAILALLGAKGGMWVKKIQVSLPGFDEEQVYACLLDLKRRKLLSTYEQQYYLR